MRAHMNCSAPAVLRCGQRGPCFELAVLEDASGCVRASWSLRCGCMSLMCLQCHCPAGRSGRAWPQISPCSTGFPSGHPGCAGLQQVGSGLGSRVPLSLGYPWDPRDPCPAGSGLQPAPAWDSPAQLAIACDAAARIHRAPPAPRRGFLWVFEVVISCLQCVGRPAPDTLGEVEG